MWARVPSMTAVGRYNAQQDMCLQDRTQYINRLWHHLPHEAVMEHGAAGHEMAAKLASQRSDLAQQTKLRIEAERLTAIAYAERATAEKLVQEALALAEASGRAKPAKRITQLETAAATSSKLIEDLSGSNAVLEEQLDQMAVAMADQVAVKDTWVARVGQLETEKLLGISQVALMVRTYHALEADLGKEKTKGMVERLQHSMTEERVALLELEQLDLAGAQQKQRELLPDLQRECERLRQQLAGVPDAAETLELRSINTQLTAEVRAGVEISAQLLTQLQQLGAACTEGKEGRDKLEATNVKLRERTEKLMLERADMMQELERSGTACIALATYAKAGWHQQCMWRQKWDHLSAQLQQTEGYMRQQRYSVRSRPGWVPVELEAGAYLAPAEVLSRGFTPSTLTYAARMEIPGHCQLRAMGVEEQLELEAAVRGHRSHNGVAPALYQRDPAQPRAPNPTPLAPWISKGSWLSSSKP